MEAEPMERGDGGLPMFRQDPADAPEGNNVAAALGRMSPKELSDLQGVEAGLQEWASPEDQQAFADL